MPGWYLNVVSRRLLYAFYLQLYPVLSHSCSIKSINKLNYLMRPVRTFFYRSRCFRQKKLHVFSSEFLVHFIHIFNCNPYYRLQLFVYRNLFPNEFLSPLLFPILFFCNLHCPTFSHLILFVSN